MNTLLRRSLSLALVTALAGALAAPTVSAQDGLARRMADRQAKKTQEQAAQYPNATRRSPEASASPKGIKLLKEMQGLYEKEDWAGVIAKAEEVAALPAANAYDKSFAYSMAGNAAANLDDQNKAIEYFSKAIAADGLDNNSHYAVMYNLVVMQYQQEKYPEALATLERFLSETKTDKPEHLSLKASLLSSMERNEEAAALWQQLAEQKPDDKRLLLNAAAALQAADKFDEAVKILEKAYQRGLLTESRELRALYSGYMNAGKWAEAQKVIEDGVAKGILQPGPDLARDYQVLAQNAYFNDDLPLAIELYRRAAPMAADGEAYLNLAKVLDVAGKKAEAKDAAKQALERGVKKPEDAKRILSR